jgi:hypothetical protein
MRQNLNSWLRNNFGLLALLMVAFFVYAPSLSGEFIVDDIPQVRDNPFIRDFSYIPRYFTKGLWENSALEITTEQRYLPMTLVPMLINYKLWGSNPFGYHLFLLMLHMTNAGLVYALIRKLLPASAVAATAGAALFVLHPTKVGSVAWIIGGCEPLATFFLLSAFLAHHSFINHLNDRKDWRYLFLSLLCFQLALWSKEVAIAFPMIVVVHDQIYKKKINWPVAFLHSMIVIGYLIARSLVLGPVGKTEGIDLSQFSRAIDFALGYIEMLVFPVHIPFYIVSPEHSVSSVLGVVGTIVIILLTGFCWRTVNAEKKKTIAFSIVWTILFFWPAILLAFYTQGFYSPRYLYAPSAGVAVLVAVFYDHINAAYPGFKIPVMASLALLANAYGFATWKEIPDWHDNGTIYRKVAEAAPENEIGFLGLGSYYLIHENYPAAEKNYLLALQKSKSPQSRASSLVALGTINGINNNLEKSESYLREAVKISPKNSDALSGLGNLAWMHGRQDEAISYYEQALSIRPDYYETAMNLAEAYDKTGQSQRGDLLRQRASAMKH